MKIAYSYIRFSSTEQLKGNSKRRQNKNAEKACRQFGWKLSDLNFHDLGVSGYRGKNAKEGKLGLFLSMLETGQLEKGAVLILEDFDRLSRNKMMNALDLVRRILEQGIEIFCTLNWKHYGKKALEEPMQLMEMLWRFFVAHSESEKKSERSKDNWIEKRKDTKTILTSICPGWLQPREDRKGFLAIPDRVKIVKRIFQLCINEHGIQSIERILNKEGIPAWRTNWNQKTIYQILTDGRVLGHLTPKEYGDTIKSCDPIKNYYPPIIDEQTYYAAMNAMQSRKLKTGRPSNGNHNLFSGLVRYPAHESTMVFLHKVKGKHSYRYLASYAGFQGLKPYVSISYARFEEVLLKWLYELKDEDFSDNADTSTDDDKVELAFLNSRIKEITLAIGKLETSIPEVLVQLATLQAKRDAAKTRIETSKRQAAKPAIKETQDLIVRLTATQGEELQILRGKIRARLHLLIDRIEVEHKKEDRIYCKVVFQGGGVRGVWYDKEVSGLWATDGVFKTKDLNYFFQSIGHKPKQKKFSKIEKCHRQSKRA